MFIEVKRVTKLPKCTIGEMYVDGVFECYTVEDTVREVKGSPVKTWKIPHVTAIPSGDYNVRITMSNRFKKLMPLLDGVEGFEGVRIHTGNTAEDTEGCIIVGAGKSITYVTQSRVAMNRLQPKIQAALDVGDNVTLRIG